MEELLHNQIPEESNEVIETEAIVSSDFADYLEFFWNQVDEI